MIEAVVIEDANILIPNEEHKNLTQTDEVIKSGTVVMGSPKDIVGMRRGETFTYRVFCTDNGKIIFLNKIKPTNKMEQTEVNFQADGIKTVTIPTTSTQKTIDIVPTKTIPTTSTQKTIDIVPTKKAITAKYYGAAIGAAAAFGFAKYKKVETKKALVYTLGGALVGFLIGNYIDGKEKQIIVTK